MSGKLTTTDKPNPGRREREREEGGRREREGEGGREGGREEEFQHNPFP